MNNKNYQPGVDFIIPAYDINTFDYIVVCVASIQKFWSKIPYTIYIVVNYENDEDVKVYETYFKEKYSIDLQDMLSKDQIQDPIKCIKVIKGLDQSKTLNRNAHGAVTQNIGTDCPGHPKGIHKGMIDGHSVGAGSWYGAWAFNKALDEGNREYVLALHEDSVFLNSYATNLLKLIETNQYKFISNRWCPGNVFPTTIGKPIKYSLKTKINKGDDEGGMARCMLFLCKRDFYDEIADQNYVEKGIWVSSPWSCDYRDMTGNVTWYALEKEYPFLILKNSYRDRFRPDNGLWKNHVLDITHSYSEQAWLDEVPIWFHHGRGGYRTNSSLDEWITKVEKYLDN